ncbi:MAG: ACT domain-containing protein [Oscillospiraceae bacterium]|nr:ACT domain-containing protein [Oscillospiraceae bacterium]
MYGVSKITSEQDIMLVTFPEIDAGCTAAAAVLQYFSDAGVIVDMISQTAPRAASVSFSFTCSSRYFAPVMRIIAEGHKNITVSPLISSGYVKINLFGEEMVTSCGVCAKALAALAAHQIDVTLITTSDLDISLLIHQENEDAALQALKEAFVL